MPKEKNTFPDGRDPDTGRFVPVKKAQKYPEKYIVESVPKRGHGDTGRGKKK